MTNNILTYTLDDTGKPISVNAIGSENLVEAVTVLAGTTAGNLIYSMPFSSINFKLFVIFLDKYENDTTTTQTITFPVAFSTINNIMINNSGLVPSISLTDVSFNPDATTVYNGVVVIIGI